MGLLAGLTIMGLSTAAAFGQSATDPLEVCAAEKDDAARLACFDRQMAQRHANHGAAQSGAAPSAQAAPTAAQSHPAATDHPEGQVAVAKTQAAASAAPQSAQAPDPNMGLQGTALRKKLKEEGREPARLAPVSATIARLVPLAHAEYGFQLDNGQIWEQTDGRGDLSLKVNDHITISPGTFGDFFFTTPAKTHIRVKRIR